jgi:hypothetical protein
MLEKLSLGSVRGLCRDSAVTGECILVRTRNIAIRQRCVTSAYACCSPETTPHFVLFMVSYTDCSNCTIGCIRQLVAAANMRPSSMGRVYPVLAKSCG